MEPSCLGPLELCHYLSVTGGRRDGSKTVFGYGPLPTLEVRAANDGFEPRPIDAAIRTTARFRLRSFER